jgi:hypothetical protein
MIRFLQNMTIFCVISIVSWWIHPYEVDSDTIPWWIGGPAVMALWATVETWWHFRDRSGK